MTADPMLAPASRPFRLAVLDTGEPVARLVAAAAELDTVTTIVVHAGGTAPWFARDADETVRDAIRKELARGGQVYYLYNRGIIP